VSNLNQTIWDLIINNVCRVFFRILDLIVGDLMENFRDIFLKKKFPRNFLKVSRRAQEVRGGDRPRCRPRPTDGRGHPENETGALQDSADEVRGVIGYFENETGAF
jgi:hypothetical protein